MDNSALTSTTPSDVKPESQADAAPKAPSAASHEEKIAQVRELTNATHQAAFQALLTFNWDVQMAVDKILNAHEATKQVLSQRNANPQAKSHHPPPLPVQHVVPVSVDDIVGPQKIDDIRCGACRSRWTDSSPDSSDGQWECRPSRGVVGISEVEGTVGDQFGIYDTEDASEAVSSAFAALLYEPRATALPWLEREYIRLQRAEVEMYKVKRAATATAEKASIGKAKQLQSPSGQEFTVVLSPEEHQEYLRRRQLPGSPQGPTSPSSPWPSLAAGASPSQGQRMEQER
ncbi:unnamed protein product [Cladocopium goreaui]|uniref:Uncharacterized protein n=1 Tax=Cladocopium goreaui TaxID=2562237 RepID=A0A9P1DJW7_9DINO|nr:unnamed protein product [Cladocopium goreaui]